MTRTLGIYGTYALLMIWTPIYLICWLFVSAGKGACEEVSLKFPREMRMIRNAWKAAKV